MSFSQTGTYVLRLTANDTQFSTSDDVTITVIADNRPPYGANVSDPMRITFGTAATFSTVPYLQDDGQPLNVTNVLWFQVSGPGVVSFANPTNALTTATFSLPGTYVAGSEQSFYTIAPPARAIG